MQICDLQLATEPCTLGPVKKSLDKNLLKHIIILNH